MATTDEMKENLIKENEELSAKIKEIEYTTKPLRKQLEYNKQILALIKKQSGKEAQPDKLKRKYTKKQKTENNFRDNSEKNIDGQV